MISFAEGPVFSQCELISRRQLPATRYAPEAVDVVDVVVRTHHEVTLGEAGRAFSALDTE